MIVVVCSTCRVRVIPPDQVQAGVLHCWFCVSPPVVIDWGEVDEDGDDGDCDTPFLVEGEK